MTNVTLCIHCRETPPVGSRLCRTHLARFLQGLNDRWPGYAPCLACHDHHTGLCGPQKGFPNAK